MIEELVAAVVKGLANSEIVRGVTCDVTVAAPIERVLELCPLALETVLDAENVRVDAKRHRLTATGFYTVTSPDAVRFKLAVQLARQGAGATRVTLSSRAALQGELASTERRRGALLDVASWLHDRAPAS